MRILLDSRAFLWLVFDDSQLPSRSRRVIEDPRNSIQLSMASIWELTMRHGLGKLPLTRPIREIVLQETAANDIGTVSILPRHIFELLALPPNPGDPFDWTIAGQCRADDFQRLSRDNPFGA